MLGEEYILIVLGLGLIIGILSAIAGLGGGILIIPASIFILGFSPKEAIVISLFVMTFLTVSATLRYIKQRKVNYKLGLLYNILDLPGVILGAFLTLMLLGNALIIICGTLIIFLSIVLFLKKDPKYEDTDPESCKELPKFQVNNLYLASISSFSGGFVSGLVGLGGGTTDTTSMILLGLDPKVAAGTSEFGMAFTSTFGFLVHFLLGTYTGAWIWPLLMGLGAMIGAQIGPLISNKLDGNSVQKLLAAFAFYTGILMYLSIFGIGWV